MMNKLIETKISSLNIIKIKRTSAHNRLPSQGTAVFQFVYEDGSDEILQLDIIKKEDIYKFIYEGKTVNLDYCYVEDFSSDEIDINKICNSKDRKIPIVGFTAFSSFFNLKENKRIVFDNAIFKNGTIDFRNCKFGDGSISFKDSEFIARQVDFRNANFGAGTISFENVKFYNKCIDFREAHFNNGNISFKSADFRGSSYFNDVKFKTGNISFNRASFGGQSVSFKGTEFANGDLDFSCTTFMPSRKDKIQHMSIDFTRSIFGKGEISFRQSYAESSNITFKDNHFYDYVNMQFAYCRFLEIIECRIENVLNLNPTKYIPVDIKRINMLNTIILGQIRLDWYKNNVKKVIYKQDKSTTFKEKAEQFRMLKENFSNLGQYDDEDESYLEYRKCEIKSRLYDRIETPKRASKRKIKLINYKNNLNQRVKFYKNKLNNQANSHILDYIKYLIALNKLYLIRPIESIRYFLKWLIFYKIGGFGTKPRNVFITMLIVVCAFAVLFTFIPFFEFNIGALNEINILGSGNSRRITHQLFSIEVGNIKNLINSFYYSGITFLTIGYGDIHPLNTPTKLLSIFEGFLGIFLMSYFTVSFVRKLLR
ncbi:MAG: potassium channel family protein [Firmicutes bacterium]|nr:potassium channel family protein [Bacillota bacterium]